MPVRPIRCAEKPWRRVTEKTVRNCFRHAGISSGVQEGVDVTDKEDDVDDDDHLPLSEWVRKTDCGVLGQYDYDAYATIDDDIFTAETQTDEEIVREMGSKDEKEAEEPEEEDKEEEEKKGELSIPTLSEALEAIMTVKRFYEATAGNSKILWQIVDIEEHLENQCWARRSIQKKITDFFF
jgi:hypothetical protein